MTAEQLTATLVQMDYPRAEVIDAVRKRFPEADVERLVDEARADKDSVDDDLADAQASNEHTDG